MLDMQNKVNTMKAIFAGKLPQKEKIIAASQQLTGVEISLLTKGSKKKLEKLIIELNEITSHYEITTFDDYSKIKAKHLDKMLNLLQSVCMILQNFIQTGRNKVKINN